MRVRRGTVRGGALVTALLVTALLVPLAAGPGAGAASAPGCQTRFFCTYVTSGGNIQITMASPFGATWFVRWGTADNPFQNGCASGSGRLPVFVGKCIAPAGATVSALVDSHGVIGFISVRDRPGRL